MPLILIFKGYILNKRSTMKPKGEDIVKLGFTKCNNLHRKKLNIKIKHFIIFEQFWNSKNVIINVMHDNLWIW
jgi:hypothetical protein